MLYHQAASAVGGERIGLRELCVKMGKGMSEQKPLLSLLKATQICPRTRQRLNTKGLIKGRTIQQLFLYVVVQKHVKETDVSVEQPLFLPLIFST